MDRRLAAALALLTVALPGVAHALDPRTEPGQYIARSWGTTHGLPQSAVTAIAQTRDGFLWVGTRAGLVRFDGITFQTLAAPSGGQLAERSTSALIVDRAGALWIGLTGGWTYRWHGGELTQMRASNPDPGSLATLHEARDGTLWAGGFYTGILRLEGGRFVRPFADGAVPLNTVMTFSSDADGTLWMGVTDGIFRARGAVVERVTAQTGVVRALLRDRSGRLWAGATGGLFRVHENGAELVLGPADGVHQILKLFEDRDGNLWIGTETGLWRWHAGRAARCDATPSLAHGEVSALFEDREGSLWVGVDGAGLTQLKDGALIRLPDARGVAVPAMVVMEDGTRDVWIGSDGAGLGRWRDGTLQRVPAEGIGDEVRAMALGPDGKLWIAGPAGTRLVTYQDGRFSVLPGEALWGEPRGLALDDRGGVWVALGGRGLQHIPANGARRLYTDAELATSQVFSLYRDRAGRLWVGQAAGITWMEDGKIVGRWAHPDGAYVVGFHQDDAGDVWIGTGVGLYRHRQGKFSSYLARHGLYAEAIMAIQEDRHGWLWLCSRKGIFRVRKADLDAVDRGAAQLTSVRYAASEGPNALECNGQVSPAASRARDGRLWFATRAGAVAIDPAKHTPPPGDTIVEALSVDGQRWDTRGTAVLPPGVHRVRLSFTMPTFLSPDAVAFRYRLDGFDADWNYAGRVRQAEYTNLPPGSYRFHVAAATADGGWREASAPITLRVRPHLWQTAPFYLACAALALAAAFAAYRLRVRRIEQRLAVLVNERNRISRELHDNLSSRLMGLKLQLDAAAMRLRDAPVDAREQLDRARAELPRSLAETRRAIWMLRTEALARGGLLAALEECGRQMTGGTDTRCEVTATGERVPLPAAVDEALLRIAQEAIGNAVRHGDARAISARLVFTARRVRLEVEDDGRGFDVAKPPPAGHFGLVGMRERARAVGGRLEIAPRTGGGTRVSVEVPLGGLSALRRWFYRRTWIS